MHIFLVLYKIESFPLFLTLILSPSPQNYSFFLISIYIFCTYFFIESFFNFDIFFSFPSSLFSLIFGFESPFFFPSILILFLIFIAMSPPLYYLPVYPFPTSLLFYLLLYLFVISDVYYFPSQFCFQRPIPASCGEKTSHIVMFPFSSSVFVIYITHCRVPRDVILTTSSPPSPFPMIYMNRQGHSLSQTLSLFHPLSSDQVWLAMEMLGLACPHKTESSCKDLLLWRRGHTTR